MMGRLYEKRTWTIACFSLLVLALAMVGCNGGNGEAQAQTQWRIVTFRIEPDSFVFRNATTKPTIQVLDRTTVYTAAAGGEVVEWTLVGAGGGFIPNSPLTLDAGEQVIERVADGTLTVIRLI